ncbi:hypothetical protein KDN24_06375 [Bacillus sp. Bva_UNVM-123]|uniref:hypothetical protein n=1 Tax=Bacillus sp. Bva_UNVM-123 TaxID=2829798 RepID=UPI00391F82F1
MRKIKVECDNCSKGKTKYYHIEEGICFKCRGAGFLFLDENKLKEIEQKEEVSTEYRKQVEAYQNEKRIKQEPQNNYTETMYSFRNRNESKMTEWEYNFISDLSDKQFMRLSDKQKYLLFKITDKFDSKLKEIIEGFFK